MSLYQWIEEVEKRCNEATPGPWYAQRMRLEDQDYFEVRDDKEDDTLCNDIEEAGDYNFISHSRIDLPKAIEMIKIMRDTLQLIDKYHGVDCVLAPGNAFEALESCEKLVGGG